MPTALHQLALAHGGMGINRSNFSYSTAASGLSRKPGRNSTELRPRSSNSVHVMPRDYNANTDTAAGKLLIRPRKEADRSITPGLINFHPRPGESLTQQLLPCCNFVRFCAIAAQRATLMGSGNPFSQETLRRKLPRNRKTEVFDPRDPDFTRAAGSVRHFYGKSRASV